MEKIVLVQDLGLLYAKESSKRKRHFGIFLCSCGKEFKAMFQNVKNGMIQSCGCKRRKVIRERSITHDKSNHCLYSVWTSMKSRCYNKSNAKYKRYGARGITICNRWLDINNFIQDMYPTYKKGLSIDRINNDGNYEPNNCRWADSLVQGHNKDIKNLSLKNPTGYIGIQRRQNGKYRAVISSNNKRINIGTYSTINEALYEREKYIEENKIIATRNIQ